MIVGSILHGAYGDYYEQLVGIRRLKARSPSLKPALFFASRHRLKEMSVFDLGFAERVLTTDDLASFRVDCFYQYQVGDPELQAEVLSRLPAPLVEMINPRMRRLPWIDLRKAWGESHDACDLPLSADGLARLPGCMRDNEIDPAILRRGPTVGFLWRYRVAGGAVSPRGQRSMEELLEVTSRALRSLIEKHGAHVFVCGMAVETTPQNMHRIDRKFTSMRLDLPEGSVTYLKGLNWGLELEILSRCSACLVMPSGFSEALWFKRRGRGVILHEPPLHYILNLLRYRMPMFRSASPANLLRYLTRQSPDSIASSVYAAISAAPIAGVAAEGAAGS
jgi:hypothetical protein